MRIFVALQPTPAFRDALASAQDRLRAAGVTGRYLSPSNLHLTLAFIGMWPEDITGLLPIVQQPFPITLSHLGVFPKAHVLWAGVKPSEALDSAARQVRQALSAAGIPFDQQDFNPHITLVRKASNVHPQGVSVPKKEMMVRKISLMKSEAKNGKMVYTEIFHIGG